MLISTHDEYCNNVNECYSLSSLQHNIPRSFCLVLVYLCFTTWNLELNLKFCDVAVAAVAVAAVAAAAVAVAVAAAAAKAPLNDPS